MRRSGLIAQKLGMSRVFQEDGKVYVAWQEMKGEKSQVKTRTAVLEAG